MTLTQRGEKWSGERFPALHGIFWALGVGHGLTTECSCKDSLMRKHVLCSLCHLIPLFPLLLEFPHFCNILHPTPKMDQTGIVDLKNHFFWGVKSWGLFAVVVFPPPIFIAWQSSIKFHVLLWLPGNAALQGGWGCYPSKYLSSRKQGA